MIDSKTIIKILMTEGWLLKRTKGSHHHFVHPERKGVVTVPHPKRHMPMGTLVSIEKQAGVKLRGVK